MSNGKKNSSKSKQSVDFREYSKALDRMFKRKNAEQQIEEIEKIAAMGKLPKDNPPDAATDD